MALQIRPGYINPLTMMADKKAVPQPELPAVRQAGQADTAEELQIRQQQLQNQMLLLKATGTDSAGVAAETQKAVTEALEKVTAELRSTSNTVVRDPAQVEQSTLPPVSRRTRDWYEPAKTDTVSPGIYQVEKKEEGYQILFSPYVQKSS